MTYAFAETVAETWSFSITDAVKIASRVASDLKRMQAFFDCPTDERIDEYLTELAVLLKHDVFRDMYYGFIRDGNFIAGAALKYRAINGELTSDSPGGLRLYADVEGAHFYSYVTRNDKWWNLTVEEKDAVECEAGISRGSADSPGTIGGVWVEDKQYGAGGRGVSRSILEPW